MKKIIPQILLAVTAVMFISCEVDSVNPEQSNQEALFEVFDAKVDFTLSREVMTECLQTTLWAGQNHDAGIVSAETDSDNIYIKFLANPDWTIEETHLSIGDCNEQWVPLTGSGNPKVGHFEHSSDHTTGVNEVVYTFPISYLTQDFCFAAHAVVNGPTGGETAWGAGTPFEGHSWATYVDALLNGCDIGDGGGPVFK